MLRKTMTTRIMKTGSLKAKMVKKDNVKGWRERRKKKKEKNNDNTYCDNWCFKSPKQYLWCHSCTL